MTEQFYKCSEFKPRDLHDGQVLLWKTNHKRLNTRMVMSGPIHTMRNGWSNTVHLLPPMTHWDGYKHSIPSDLEWAYAPEWIKEKATVPGRDGKPVVLDYKLVRLLEVEGVHPLACPFCGEKATWESRDGFIGSMPHQENQFSVGCCMRTAYYAKPADAVARWNRRAMLVITPPPEYF